MVSARRENGYRAPKPLPFWPILVICISSASAALSETVLFPFAAFMVASFHVTDDSTKLGYYAGFLASAFYCGSLLCSGFWGVLSDRIGRKYILVLGLVANALCALGFGFSSSFSMALTIRFVNGLFNCLDMVGRTVVSELCDDSNQAQGISLLGACWGIGFLIGPALGGLMSELSKKFPSYFPADSLFGRYPYSPPCLLLTAVSSAAFLSVLLVLPETKGRATAMAASASNSTLSAPLLTQDDGTHVETGQDPPAADPGSVRAFFMRDTVLCALIQSMLCLATSSQNVVFPLWSMTSLSLGGLGFGTSFIGMAQASSGLALIPFQLFLFSRISDSIGPLSTLKVMLAAMAALTFFPTVHYFTHPHIRLLLCFLFMMIRGITVISSFTSSFICLTNSITQPQHLGAINGILQTMTMVFETVGPTVGSCLYAWSIQPGHGFPFNYCLYWILWGLNSAAMLSIALLLPNNVNSRKFITI